MIRESFNFLIHPKKTLATEKPNASLGKGAKNLLVFSFILGLMLAIGSIAIVLFFKLPIFFLYFAAVLVILFPIQSIVGVSISSGILYVIGKLLGGKGNFEQLFYLNSVLHRAILLLITPAIFLYFLILFSGPILFNGPYAGQFFLFLALFMAISVYFFYLQILMLKEVFEFSMLKTLAMGGVLVAIPILIIGTSLFSLYSVSVSDYINPFEPSACSSTSGVQILNLSVVQDKQTDNEGGDNILTRLKADGEVEQLKFTATGTIGNKKFTQTENIALPLKDSALVTMNLPINVQGGEKYVFQFTMDYFKEGVARQVKGFCRGKVI